MPRKYSRKNKIEEFSYADPGTKKVEVQPGIGSGDPIPTMDRALLFQTVGITGLTRFGGMVYEEFLRELQGPNGIALLREMRENHPVVSAVFFAIEMAVRQVSWKVEPPKDGNTELSDLIEEARDDMSSTWNDIVSQIMTMLQYGYSLFELVYKVRRGSEFDPGSKYADGKIGWRKWMPISQDTLAPGRNWIFDAEGGVQGINQMAPPDWKFRTIPIDKMLHFRTTAAKNNPEGRSIMRGMYTSWYFSKNLQEIEGIAAERMGTGLPVMYLGDDTKKTGTNSDLALAQSIVRDTRADEQMGVVIPYAKMGQGATPGNGALFELVAPPSRGQVDFSEAITRYDKRIAMAVLAQFLMLGMGEHGSFALAKSHSDLFALAMESWGDMIASVINRYAIPRLLNLNGYKNEDLPQIVHSEIEVSNLVELADYVNKLVGAQVLTPDARLEDDLREKARLPKRIPEINSEQFPSLTQDEVTRDPETLDPGAKPPADPATKPPVDPTTQSPKAPEQASEKFQQLRRAYGGGKYETSNQDYQLELERIYKLFWTAILGGLLAADNYEGRREILVAGLDGLQNDLIKAGRRGLNDAFDLGLAGEAPSPDGLTKLQQRVQANESYIRDTLIPGIRQKADTALREQELIDGGEDAVGGLFQTMNGRIANGAGAQWVSIWDGMGDHLRQQSGGDQRRIERVLDPAAEHCEECEEFAHTYTNFAEMEFVAGIPGDGNTSCFSNCRCILRVETVPGSGEFVRL